MLDKPTDRQQLGSDCFAGITSTSTSTSVPVAGDDLLEVLLAAEGEDARSNGVAKERLAALLATGLAARPQRRGWPELAAGGTMGDVHTTTERATSERRPVLPGVRVVAGAALAIAAIAAVMVLVWGNDDDTLRLSNLPEGVTAHAAKGNDLFVARYGTEVRAFVPDARHLPDDILWWCPNEQIFVEVEHGSQFDRDGLHMAGPAQGALNQHPVELDGDQVIINTDRVIQGADVSAGGSSSERPDDSGSGRWPPNSGPDSICQDPVAAPPSAARQLEPHTGPQH